MSLFLMPIVKTVAANAAIVTATEKLYEAAQDLKREPLEVRVRRWNGESTKKEVTKRVASRVVFETSVCVLMYKVDRMILKHHYNKLFN